MPDDREIIWHQSGVNRDGDPFIQLIRGTEVIAQMSVEQARDHGMAMLESAEAAEQDAFIVFFMKSKVGVGDREAAGILKDFRDFRREHTGKRSGQEVLPPKDKTK